MTSKIRKTLGIFCIGLLWVNTGWAQRNFDQVQIQPQKLSDNIYVLFGSGGNIGLSLGEDGAFIIDDQFAPLTDKINQAITDLGGGSVQFVVNTHWHGDHTGGNENYGKAGAVIIAHENVRKRMSVDAFSKTFNITIEASPKEALPVITFPDSVTLHLNGDTMQAFHMPNGHTDGDAMIHFMEDNIIHMGDVFFNGMYPFIDVESGGGIRGMAASVTEALSRIDDETQVIPGHGPVTDKARLTFYRDMLTTIGDRVEAMIQDNKTVEEVIASDVTEEFEADWGNGFMKKDRFLGLVYASLKP